MKKLLLSGLLLLAMLVSACNGSSAAEPGEFAGIANRGGVIATLNGQNIYEAEYNHYFGLYLQNNYEQAAGLLHLLGIDLDTEEGLTEFLADIEQMAWSVLLDSEAIRQVAAQRNLVFEHPGLADVVPWGTFQFMVTNSLYSQLFGVIHEEMLQEVAVDEDAARIIYENAPDTWDSLLTSHILILFDQNAADPEADRLSAYQRAWEVLELLNAGADFAQMAQEHSGCASAPQGGLIDSYINVHGFDVLTGGSFFPEYVAAAHTLTAIGQFTPAPVESGAGYHIIIVDDMRTTFEDSFETIAATLRDVSSEAVQERIWDLIAEHLENGTVVRHQEYLYSSE